MLAEIYLLKLELAAQASEQKIRTPEYDFVPFALEACRPEKTSNEKRTERL